MLHLKDNIKKIRKAYKETQEKFAARMGVSLPMQKTYEGGKSNPDIIYLEGLSKVSGISMEQLKNSNLDYSLISEKVTKVTIVNHVPGLGSSMQQEMAIQPNVLFEFALQSNEERIKELKEHNAFLQRMIETSLGKLDRIERLSESTLADLKGSMKYQAEREAKGNIAKQEDIESHVSKLAGDALVVILSSNKSEVPYK